MLHTWCEAVTTLNLNDVCKLYIFFENLCHMVVLIADKFTSVFFLICWCVCVQFFFKYKSMLTTSISFRKIFRKIQAKMFILPFSGRVCVQKLYSVTAILLPYCKSASPPRMMQRGRGGGRLINFRSVLNILILLTQNGHKFQTRCLISVHFFLLIYISICNMDLCNQKPTDHNFLAYSISAFDGIDTWVSCFCL